MTTNPHTDYQTQGSSTPSSIEKLWHLQQEQHLQEKLPQPQRPSRPTHIRPRQYSRPTRAELVEYAGQLNDTLLAVGLLSTS